VGSAISCLRFFSAFTDGMKTVPCKTLPQGLKPCTFKTELGVLSPFPSKT
jgi:hypothetical protein